jgi:SM-20-related protein
MAKQFDAIIDSYIETNIGIDANFLSASLSQGLQQNILQLQQDNQMFFAGIGNDEVKDGNQKMRGDKIYWLDKKHNNEFELEFLQLVDDFIEELNSSCYTGINGSEFHYAVYGQGSFYKKHLDQFKNNTDRKFSLISYLNTDWLDEDGGKLIAYQNETEQSILPQSQTGVFFKSSQIEHEVQQAHRSRMSVTGWLKCM